MMDSIFEIIDEIERRPGMYVQRGSIIALRAFIDGWLFAKQMAGGDDAQRDILRDFQRWISGELGIETSQHWASIILFFSHDDMEAYETFFSRWKLFRSQHN